MLVEPGLGPEYLVDGRWRGDHGIGRFATEVLSRLGGVTVLGGDRSPSSPTDPIWLARRVVAARPRVFFSPGYNSPLISARPYVCTIHDLIHVEFSASSTTAKRLFFWSVVRRSVRRAARVLTVSEFSRRRIVRWAGIDPGRVVNVGNGVSREFVPQGPVADTAPGYVLNVGSNRPHKNRERLVAAFAESGVAGERRLVLTGAAERNLQRIATRHGVGSRIEFTGHVNDQSLAALYRGAVCLVVPSLYEGFGLPALEAMACGTPVIAADNTSLPEVCGDAAVLVHPLDIRALATAIRRVAADATLRRRLVRSARERVALHSWDQTSAAVVRILREVAQADARSRDVPKAG